MVKRRKVRTEKGCILHHEPLTNPLSGVLRTGCESLISCLGLRFRLLNAELVEGVYERLDEPLYPARQGHRHSQVSLHSSRVRICYMVPPVSNFLGSLSLFQLLRVSSQAQPHRSRASRTDPAESFPLTHSYHNGSKAAFSSERFPVTPLSI